MTLQISRMPGQPHASHYSAGMDVPDAAATAGKTGPKKEYHEFLVLLDDQATEQVDKAFEMPMGKERREYVANTLIDNMMKTQQPLWGVLDGLKAAGHVDPQKGYQPLWLQNAIVVHGDETAEQVMSSAAGVAQAVRSAQISVGNPAQSAANEFLHMDGGPGETKAGADPQWNIKRIGAEKAWADGLTGKGVTLGIIDTGVDVEHPALLTNFRGYNSDLGVVDTTANWYDATGKSPDKAVDEGAHGTHVAGTAVGTDGRNNKIGVAPDAQWVAARGLGDKGGTDGMLLQSFQNMVAPRVPTPGVMPGSKRDIQLGVDIINNSWGSDNGLSTSYLHALRNMAAMGVINVFAAGNDGQGGKLGTLGSPASSPYVISVGATDRNDDAAKFSSRGPNPLPSPSGEPSPFVAAPGEDIRSAVPGGRYERGWQGTSMAAPAIAGYTALVQQAAKEETGSMFDVLAMKDVLKRAAQDVGPEGIDTGTGYGIPVADNLRGIVRDVAQERGLLAAAKEAAASAVS